MGSLQNDPLRNAKNAYILMFIAGINNVLS